MLKGYGVTHIFHVPAVLRTTFAEMETRAPTSRAPHARREVRRLHGGRLRARLGQARHLHGAGDRRAQSRGRPARRLARAFAGDRDDRRARAEDEVPQGLSGDRRRAGVRAGDQVQCHGRRRRALSRHGAAGVPRRGRPARPARCICSSAATRARSTPKKPRWSRWSRSSSRACRRSGRSPTGERAARRSRSCRTPRGR